MPYPIPSTERLIYGTVVDGIGGRKITEYYTGQLLCSIFKVIEFFLNILCIQPTNVDSTF